MPAFCCPIPPPPGFITVVPVCIVVGQGKLGQSAIDLIGPLPPVIGQKIGRVIVGLGQIGFQGKVLGKLHGGKCVLVGKQQTVGLVI